MTTPNTRVDEQVRQKIEKVLWKHYNDGGYAMNGEEASQEIMKIFDSTLLSLIDELEREIDERKYDFSDTQHQHFGEQRRMYNLGLKTAAQIINSKR